MQPLHPTEAIVPAFNRARQVLLQPFRLGRALKLALCSYLSVTGWVFFPLPLFVFFIPRSVLPPQLPLTLLFALTLIPFALQCALFYIGNRMSLVEFEMLATESRVIAPMWRRYGKRVWPLVGVKALSGTLLFAVLAPVIVSQFHRFYLNISQLHQIQGPGAPADPALMYEFFRALAGLYAIFLGALLLLKLFDTLLNDFVLPFYAIEELSLREATHRGWNVIRREPWQIVLYLLVKVALTLVGSIALQIVSMFAMIPLLLVFAVLTGIGAVLAHVLTGAIGHLLLMCLAALFYVALYLAFLAFISGCAGFLMGYLEAYAIYFLGGRYDRLAGCLERPEYTYTPPPSLPSSDEDDDGPTLPMDPALA